MKRNYTHFYVLQLDGESMKVRAGSQKIYKVFDIVVHRKNHNLCSSWKTEDESSYNDLFIPFYYYQ